ncbi:hypothetical protein INT44_001761 [Umbelopsis vinacea]|uniref:Uncharacterized protein n=1 Tax=Umbelopsis vinacea TaxID=44442 RepID=A0A8H7PR19_9FUNG|nr:hypothetical protein INT44_001761 [Umbelopsis vinacea]
MTLTVTEDAKRQLYQKTVYSSLKATGEYLQVAKQTENREEEDEQTPQNLVDSSASGVENLKDGNEVKDEKDQGEESSGDSQHVIDNHDEREMGIRAKTPCRAVTAKEYRQADGENYSSNYVTSLLG